MPPSPPAATPHPIDAALAAIASHRSKEVEFRRLHDASLATAATQATNADGEKAAAVVAWKELMTALGVTDEKTVNAVVAQATAT